MFQKGAGTRRHSDIVAGIEFDHGHTIALGDIHAVFPHTQVFAADPVAGLEH